MPASRGRLDGTRERRGRSLYSRRGGAPPASPSCLVDGDVLARHRPLAHPRSDPGDGRRLLLRGEREDQRLHRRVPGAEPAALTRCRSGALGRVRAGLQPAARQGEPGARLACGLERLLPDAGRARRGDRVRDHLRAADHQAVRRPGRRCAARDRAHARPLPHRLAARALRDRGRDPQQLRRVHDPGAHAGVLEPRDHRGPGARRAERAHDEREALRLRVLDPDRHRDPGADPAALALRSRRPPPRRLRLARPDGAPGLHADDSRDPRSRPHQLQRSGGHALRLAAARSGARTDGNRQGVPHLHAPAGDLLGRDRHCALPDHVAARGDRGLGRLPRHGRSGSAADGLPARARERHGGSARDADRAPPLPAGSVHAAADDGGRRRAGRVLARPRLQRRDADAEPRLLQPPGELDPDDRRAREPRRSTRCSTGRSTASGSGGFRSRPRS